MHGDAAGLLLSVLLIAFFMLCAFLISRLGRDRLGDFCPEVARKVVHIGVSNWFFIYYYVFETDLWPVLGLGAFALINTVLNLSGGLHVLMGQESRKRNWGLVQYPVSIILLILLRKAGIADDAAIGCAVLGMGYGDGLASIVGMKVKSGKLPGESRKTVAGSVTMACTTFAVVMIICLVLRPDVSVPRVLAAACVTAVAASAVEAFTPFGLDNLTVPLSIFFIVGLML